MKQPKAVQIIAEAGVNHNGDIALAMKLVDAAVAAGADIIKFQTFRANNLVTSSAEKAPYQKQHSGNSTSQLDMLSLLELNLDNHLQLIEYCDHSGIEFLSTAFDHQSVELLSKLKLKRWKIPSGEITNLPYLRLIGSHGQPVILSTGMSDLGDIESALSALEVAGTSRNLVTVLHCTTEYPAPPQEVNLRAMNTISKEFGVSVGYSDHTDGIIVPLAAVAIGATVIEKHITLDRNLTGPDHRSSLEPEAFRSMVQGIRIIEESLGDGIKTPTPSERINLPLVRKSIVASRPIRQGDVFSNDNLTTKRPGTGISPMEWDSLIGSIATRDYAQDDLIQ